LTVQRSSYLENVRLVAQFSTDLNDWSEEGVFVSATDQGGGLESLLFRSPALASGELKKFARIEVMIE